ncbi:MAG: type IV secretion system protein VirB11 [Candidatus Aenigmatarchaeota archaeon]|nr:MAG: type IV secretion system protein VirB11 [Candidatus Aenigmarchaeota archaeon]
MKLRIPVRVIKKSVKPSLSAIRIVRKMKKGYVQKLKTKQSFPRPKEKPQIIITPVPQIVEEKKEEKLGHVIGGVKAVKGIEIPKELKIITQLPVREEDETIEAVKNVNIFYNLIPRKPKPGDKVFAYAHIKWEPSLGQVVYNVIEPPLSQDDKKVIENIKRELEDRLDVDFVKIGEVKAKEILREELEKIMASYKIDPQKRTIFNYYIERDIIGLGKIEPLMRDPNIEDISCDGVNIPIYVYHRDPTLGSLRTNILFTDKDELDSFVIKLAQKCRKTISIAEPLLDASLPDGSRVQATLGTDIARKGSNFTIRKFAEEPMTPTHMLEYNVLDSTMLAYLWLAIENGMSVLISGGTATGKTTLLNALSLFIRPNLKIVSIEDTPELRLPHPHWIPEVARTPLEVKGKRGEVSLFDLLKSSLRQRPDYIIMGEVRGKEAFVLFQQMATGHPSLATIHAASIEQLADRLTTPPISLPPALLQNIDIIVFLVLLRLRGNYVRRAESILEVVGVERNLPVTNKVFEWDASSDSFKTVSRSAVLEKIAKKLGMNEDEVKNELMRRKVVLEWMHEKGVFDYREVAKIISTYYTNPERILDLVMQSMEEV